MSPSGKASVFEAEIRVSESHRPSQHRGVAQSIERGIWDAEVAGLSPVTPTTLKIIKEINNYD